MYNFSFDKTEDYIFDSEGFPIGRAREDDGMGDERHSFDSKKSTLRAACIEFLEENDTGDLYDVDEDVIGDNEETISVDFVQDHDGSWYVRMDGEMVNKYSKP